MKSGRNGKAAASLIFGIIGLLTGWFLGVGCVLGIVGVVLAVKSGNERQMDGLPASGLATAGLILGIIAIVYGSGYLICTVCAGAAVGCLNQVDVENSLQRMLFIIPFIFKS